MRYGNATAFRQALEERLKTRAHGDGAQLARDRKRVVFDRLLARLLAVAPGRWLLKGGFALELRLAGRARATKDVDIDWQADEELLLDTLIDAATHDPGDYFTFTIERTGAPEDRLGGSHRFRVSASLAGRQFETFLLDVGFRRDEDVTADTLTTEALLGFADIPPVEVLAVPLEIQIAEKLHAYTRTYEGGRPSTRAKDLVDLALIATNSTLDAALLRMAIDRAFTRRTTHPLPTALPQPPGDWASQYRRLAQEVGAPADLDAGYADASAFLAPILSGETTNGLEPPRAGSGYKSPRSRPLPNVSRPTDAFRHSSPRVPESARIADNPRASGPLSVVAVAGKAPANRAITAENPR
ncbi:MAG TPA: nucleotidyl transferase AbiEii/AbiGii toxin family protein [Solirubrobacteraceae bacterium]|nr:nucleotidyl transferase AbiEii/AbiGii toxin family protein [Solirubrobacteraceae bacterium]